MNLKKSYTRFAAIVTAGILTSVSDASATGFQEITSNINTSVSEIPSLISTVAYIGGAGLGVTGIVKMRDHVNSPQQTPLKDGLVRLGAGGGMLALPAVLEAMSATVGTGGSITPTTIPVL